MPEQVRAAAAGVLGYQMAAGFEQAAALDCKQRGAAQSSSVVRQGLVRGAWQQGLPGRRQRGRLPRAEGAYTLAFHGRAVEIAIAADDLERGVQVLLGPVNQLEGGKHVQARLVLKEIFTQGQDGAEMVLRKDEPGAGGSRNLPIKS
ncbi:MAG: hypothetical protein NTY67_11215 [Cyanobacteria bacterium]|nr:hypothetical protein [Cyanobacteriota bacterium]